MPSINMIAPRRAEKRRVERDMRRLVVVIIVELVFAVGLGLWICTRLVTTKNQIAELDTQIQNLAPVVDEIERYEQRTQKLMPKLNLLNQAKDETMRWYNTLDRLTQCVPSSAWLSSISTQKNRDDGGLTINLSGTSATQANVGEAMLRLYTIQEIQDISLHFTRSSSSSQGVGVDFEIGAHMRAQEQQAKGVKQNGSGQS